MGALSRPQSPMGAPPRPQSPIQVSALSQRLSPTNASPSHQPPSTAPRQSSTSPPVVMPTALSLPAKRPRDDEPSTGPLKRVRSKPTTAPVHPKPKARASKKATASKAQGPLPSISIHPPIPVTPFKPASNAPKWFISALRKLQSTTIDERFNTLIHTWATFEVKEGYAEVSKLDSKHRPSVIGDWIQRGRNEKWVPPGFDSAKFENQFKQWWFHLQPVWRRATDQDVAWGSIEGDLVHLKKPGTNGLLSVVAGLFFWGINVKNGSPEWDRYVAYVNDIQAVLSGLVSPTSSF